MRETLVAAAALAGGAVAQAGAWQQCGGSNWSGDTTCVSGYTCAVINDYYSQCTPSTDGDPPATTTTAGSPPDDATTLTTIATPTNDGPGTPTGSGTNPGSTLVSGWYWVRGVESPNFHSYLQTQPTGLPSDAYLDDASQAGQFNIVDGQLVYNTGTGGELYMHVEDPEDKTQRKLETWFAEAENDYGAFAFQGDTVTWHTDDIDRPNEAAWLICEDQQLFVNTGAYAYDTPAGCSDSTIHSYGGATADV